MNEHVAAEIVLLEAEREIDRLRAQRDLALSIISRVLASGGMFTAAMMEEARKLESEVLK
jgi:hypothetical protein